MHSLIPETMKNAHLGAPDKKGGTPKGPHRWKGKGGEGGRSQGGKGNRRNQKRAGGGRERSKRKGENIHIQHRKKKKEIIEGPGDQKSKKLHKKRERGTC